MQVTLPTPKTWEDFELWSKKVIKKLYPDIIFNIYGRQGQKQFGIDIISINQTERIAVQCKRVETINQSIVSEELRKLSEYDGSIRIYYIFTTASRDARILDSLQNINTHILIDLKFWEDITEIIRENSDLMTEYCTSVNINKNLYHSQDVNIINNIMGTIHIPTLIKTLNSMPKYIDADFLGVYFECFNSAVSQYSMYIHDEKIKKLFSKIRNNLEEMFCIGVPYYRFAEGINSYVFYIPGDAFLKNDSEKAYNRIDELRKNIHKDYQVLHEYIMSSYPEVNLLELSENARKELLKVYSEMNF